MVLSAKNPPEGEPRPRVVAENRGQGTTTAAPLPGRAGTRLALDQARPHAATLASPSQWRPAGSPVCVHQPVRESPKVSRRRHDQESPRQATDGRLQGSAERRGARRVGAIPAVAPKALTTPANTASRRRGSAPLCIGPAGIARGWRRGVPPRDRNRGRVGAGWVGLGLPLPGFRAPINRFATRPKSARGGAHHHPSRSSPLRRLRALLPLGR